MKTLQRSLTLFAGLLLGAAAALAQGGPGKPVNLMVPYPAGGPSDAIARILFNPLGKELGQQVLVENLGGVSGALAAQKVLAAPADGHYLFQGSPNEVILSPLANAAVKLKTEDFRLVHWRTCPTRATRRCCRTSPAARSTLPCWSTAPPWARWLTRAG